MRYRLVPALPADGEQVDVDGRTVEIRGGVGRATVVVVPSEVFRLSPEDQQAWLRTCRETIRRVSGVEDAIVVDDSISFVRMRAEEDFEDLRTRVEQALDTCTSRCLDDSEDREAVVSALLRALA